MASPLFSYDRGAKNREKALDLFLTHNKDIQEIEGRMRGMELDDALLVLDVSNWKLRDVAFFDGYLTARTRQVRAQMSWAQHTMLAANVVEDCGFLNDLFTTTKIPAMVSIYAISRLTVAITEGVNLGDYILDKYRISDLTPVDSEHVYATGLPPNGVDETPSVVDEDQQSPKQSHGTRSYTRSWFPDHIRPTKCATPLIQY
ncbi:hypothetical protein GGR53DRAFT_263787 [Hypoxylon sp. FL1150]|nr:hypothetical protein GGR53DRAFT_263787 [Hypoxylon sp. FL1150]